jgi:hypothetical protein
VRGIHRNHMERLVRARERKVEPSAAIRQRLKPEIAETGRCIPHACVRFKAMSWRWPSPTIGCLRREFHVATRVVSLALRYSPFFAWRDPDTADLAPDFKVGACVLDLCCFHDSSQFLLHFPTSENVKRRQLCSPPDVCSCPPYRSERVSTS